MPAFWWLHNMYALARNSWKFRHRDKRVTRTQHIEFDYLAPDTVEEILVARDLLALWSAKAVHGADAFTPEELVARGRELLESSDGRLDKTKVLAEGMEKSRRPARVIKPAAAYRAYGDMLLYYGVSTLLSYVRAHPEIGLLDLSDQLAGPCQTAWTNLGGQLMRDGDIDSLRRDIGSGQLSSWDDIHARYDALWEAYPKDKACHAYAVLCGLRGVELFSSADWLDLLDGARKIQDHIRDQVRATRAKDYENPFRRATYRSVREMTAAIGTVDDNSFVQQVADETIAFAREIEEAMSSARVGK